MCVYMIYVYRSYVCNYVYIPIHACMCIYVYIDDTRYMFIYLFSFFSLSLSLSPSPFSQGTVPHRHRETVTDNSLLTNMITLLLRWEKSVELNSSLQGAFDWI